MDEFNGIRGMPVHERPRERAYLHGMQQLSTAELLAILISTGTKGIGALQLAQLLLTRFSDEGVDPLANLGSRSISELQKVKGLGRAKATRILAALELGRRLLSSDAQASPPVFGSPRSVFEYYRPRMMHLNHEEFVVVLLNNSNRLIKSVTISKGILNATVVHPREVFREAIVESAASVILVHNHPSGNPQPSMEDLRMTSQLVSAGKIISIPVIDHVIVTCFDFKSIIGECHGVEKCEGEGKD